MPSSAWSGHSGRPIVPLLAALLSWGAPAGAQELLPLQRDYPGPGPFACPASPAPAAPTDDQRERAAQLASDAVQASILGDLEGARTLLSQATAADGTSPEFAYRHARVLEDLELADAAILEYCRAIDRGAPEAGIVDSRERLDALYEIVRERISDLALQAFVLGIRQADTGFYADAAGSFALAIEERPDWSAAVYNRAIVLEELGLIQESLAEYRRYLELTPSEIAPDVVNVSERIGMLEGELARPTPNPGSALALGVLLPGMGQYYSGRGRAGTVVLSAAVAAVVTGFMVKEVTIRCLMPVDPGQDCPSNQVVDETTRRPYLVPALGATAAVGVVAAIEAFVRARRQRAQQGAAVPEVTESRPVTITGPSVTASARGVDVTLLGLRFR